MFQPISNCSLGSIQGIQETISTKDADSLPPLAASDYDELSAFLTRPSDAALEAASNFMAEMKITSWNSTGTRTAGVYIRQRHSELLNKAFYPHVWAPEELLHVLLQISVTSYVTHFIIISDDPYLAPSAADLSSSRGEKISIAYPTNQGDDVKNASSIPTAAEAAAAPSAPGAALISPPRLPVPSSGSRARQQCGPARRWPGRSGSTPRR